MGVKSVDAIKVVIKGCQNRELTLDFMGGPNVIARILASGTNFLLLLHVVLPSFLNHPSSMMSPVDLTLSFEGKRNSNDYFLLACY